MITYLIDKKCSWCIYSLNWTFKKKSFCILKKLNRNISSLSCASLSAVMPSSANFVNESHIVVKCTTAFHDFFFKVYFSRCIPLGQKLYREKIIIFERSSLKYNILQFLPKKFFSFKKNGDFVWLMHIQICLHYNLESLVLKNASYYADISLLTLCQKRW